LNEVSKLNFIRKTALLHAGKEAHIITPMQTSPYITASEFKGHYFVFSNSIGYAVLRDIMIAACVLEDNEIIHLSMDFEYQNEYRKDFSEPENHFTSLIFRNYCACRLKTKDIVAAIKTPTTSRQETVTRFFPLTEDYIENWKSRRRLTVKAVGNSLILSSNRDVFTSMAQSCKSMSELEDDEDMNNSPPHMHHDWDENTAKSVGITFYYWTPPISKEGHQ
jgi:hypothetical protein